MLGLEFFHVSGFCMPPLRITTVFAFFFFFFLVLTVLFYPALTTLYVQILVIPILYDKVGEISMLVLVNVGLFNRTTLNAHVTKLRSNRCDKIDIYKIPVYT